MNKKNSPAMIITSIVCSIALIPLSIYVNYDLYNLYLIPLGAPYMNWVAFVGMGMAARWFRGGEVPSHRLKDDLFDEDKNLRASVGWCLGYVIVYIIAHAMLPYAAWA